MSRGRTTAVAVVMVGIIALCGACSSGSSKASTAAVDKHAAAANKAAAARSRAKRARKRAAAIRLRAERAARAKKHKTKHKTTKSTTPTTSRVGAIVTADQPASTVAPVLVQSAPTPAMEARDLAAIERAVTALNSAFATNVAAGINKSKQDNYWVPSAYTANQCGAFETARGGGVVGEQLVVDPASLTAAPGWVDPVVGRVPQGRIYAILIAEIQTLVTTGRHRERTLGIHVTVRRGEHARLFLRCA